jgi:hypothetical protein
MKDNDENLLKSASEINEKITIGLILRGQSSDIKKLKFFIEETELQLIFKKISLDNLYVINQTDYQKLTEFQDKE